MSFATAEKIFFDILNSDDPELRAVVEAWCPWYASKQYSSYEDGEEVREALREHGFEPTTAVKLSHSRVVALAIEAGSGADVSAAASAFVLSASGGRHWWQNPLRAVSIIRNLPKHRFEGSESCDICGTAKEEEWLPLDVAQRFPGGFSGEDWQVLDNLMMVRWFRQAQCPPPTSDDLAAFRRVLQVIADAPPTDSSVKVASLLKKQLKGPVDPWRYFLETLGYAGVLKTEAQPGNLQVWTNRCDRKYGQGEVATPCCHWRRSHGFDANVFAELFPQVKLPANLKAKKSK
ncbi:MAG: hypothetical protein KDB14_12910 [Planctomycetales bacterium]|nr:hypothetical protein [Planctomycetales bacterium]